MIKIELLKNNLDAIPELALIWRELLGKIWLPEVPLEAVEQRFRDHANNEKMPIMFVALDGKKPVGMCSLRENDGIRPDLMPWLGSLTVKSEYQNQGLGKRLIEVTKEQAKKMGYDMLYLFAFDRTVPNYYQSLGWKIIDTDHFKGHPVTVMETSLGPR
ncbi:acetyltransferase [Legionella steigerwaltii]|uniref:Acetyltransferase n=1 Tax=Legionella steigerwaltii TaxID=460 RepID=A0A378L939_9GAMM|nr:GNAT family N-acetyltransferase [Legionella steigerwaltii]KTD78034.1 GNAT family acetyltransferase [Legionella steigerwaltii]STY22229.1 acetyltransferase [Legionella steigerwaltii]